MKTQTKIIIGLAVATLVFGGLFIRQLTKSGQEKEAIRQNKLKIKDLEAHNTFLEDYAKEIEKKLIDEKGNVARLSLREQIYLDKIKIDSALLKEVQTSNERIDSLSDSYTLADWNCFIANEISEDGCN